MTRPIAIVVACASLLLAGSVHGRQAPPATAGATPAQDQRPDIYDETADARAVIDAAVARARKDNKHVLVQWGANWCGWCHLLHQHFRDQREVARKLLYEYEVVLVDVGRFDRNMELATSLGAELRGNGIPFLTVLDGEGRPLANQPTGPLEAKIDGRPGHDPDKVLAFLTRHQAPPLAAESVLAAARDRAAKEGKLVFLHFGAPWCGWCRRLEAWLESAPVAKVWAKDFVDVKVDTDRMIGGDVMLKSMTKGVASGIPWFAMLDPDGTVVATSFVDGDRNLGCPWTDPEVAAFKDLLRRVCRSITTDEIDAITSKLGEKAKNYQ